MNTTKVLAITALLWAAGTRADISVSSQSPDLTVAVGNQARLYVAATAPGGHSITNCLWYRRTGTNAYAVPIAGASATNYIFTTTTTNDSGAYYCVMVDDEPSTNLNSQAIMLTVLNIAQPAIISGGDLTNKFLAAGSSFTFKLGCTNQAGDYFWYHATNSAGGWVTNLMSGDANTYAISGAAGSDSGYYFVVLSNLAGMKTSATSTLTVQKRPSITNGLTSATSNTVPMGTAITNVVGVDGDSLTYQWFKGTAAAGSTSNTLIIASAGTNDAGKYYLVITNQVGATTSSNYVLTVIPPPVIGTQPKSSTTLTNGQTLSLSVKATGVKPYTNLMCQWTFNVTNRLANATNNSLVISNMVSTNAGNYAVIVTNFGGATTSAVAVVAVGADTTSPVLKITEPSKTNWVSTNAIFTMKGTATDNVSLTNVLLSYDGVHFTNNAVSVTNQWAKWSADVSLQPGSNTIWVMALDYSGNATTNTQRLFYAKWYSLTVTNTGDGSGSYVGLKAQVQYGSNYLLTAKADNHCKFIKWVGWSGASTNIWTNSFNQTTNVFRFTCTNDVAVTNEFDTNRFWNAAGTYNGLFTPAVSLNTNTMTHITNATSYTNVGFFTATVTTNLTYSAKAYYLGQTISFSGSFATNGTANYWITPSAYLNFGLGSQQMWGLLSCTNSIISLLVADLAYYSKTNPTTALDGAYTIVIPPDVNSIGGATNGYGYGIAKVSTNGTVTFTGASADGTVVSQSVAISQDGFWPLYAQLYTTKTNAVGALVGWVNVTNNAGSPDGVVAWIKSANMAGFTNYVSGLTNVSTLRGSGFTAPAKTGSPVLTNFILGTITFTGGGMTRPVTNWIFLDTDGTVYSYDPAISVKFGKDGLMSGKFYPNASAVKPTSFNGVVLQSTNQAFGSFSTSSGTGSVDVEPYSLR